MADHQSDFNAELQADVIAHNEQNDNDKAKRRRKPRPGRSTRRPKVRVSSRPKVSRGIGDQKRANEIRPKGLGDQIRAKEGQNYQQSYQYGVGYQGAPQPQAQRVMAAPRARKKIKVKKINIFFNLATDEILKCIFC